MKYRIIPVKEHHRAWSHNRSVCRTSIRPLTAEELVDNAIKWSQRCRNQALRNKALPEGTPESEAEYMQARLARYRAFGLAWSFVFQTITWKLGSNVSTSSFKFRLANYPFLTSSLLRGGWREPREN